MSTPTAHRYRWKKKYPVTVQSWQLADAGKPLPEADADLIARGWSVEIEPLYAEPVRVVPSVEEIEAAARSIFDTYSNPHTRPWEDLTADTRRFYTNQARAALVAGLAVRYPQPEEQ